MPDDAWWVEPRAAACGPWPATLPGVGGALAWLAGHGLQPGQRLGLLAGNCPAACSLIQAAGLAGLDLVLLNRRLLPDELAQQLAGVECAAVAVGGECRAPAGLRALPLPEAFAEQALPPLRDDGGAALVVFTSGSTGAGKAVRLPWPRLRLAAEAARLHLGFGRDDGWLACLPLDHIGGASLALRAAWSGCRLRLHRRFDLARADADLDRCAFASLVPTMLHRLVAARGGRRWPAGLRCLLVGGAALAPDLAEACSRLGLAACATYGLSEAASMACAQRPGDGSRPPGRVGSPLPGIELAIHDAGADGIGAIALRGAHLTPGHERDWLVTGDLGRLHPDGLEVLGRRDEVILCGGEKIAPDQVEGVLLGHPAIADAIVAACPDREWGAVVVAGLVARGTPPDDASLSAWLADHLGGPRRPRRWLWLPELPRTSLGKPRRAAVGQLFTSAKTP